MNREKASFVASIPLLLVCLLASGVSASRAARPSVTTARSPWEAFDLDSVKLGKHILHYEKSLEGKIESVRESFERFLSGSAEARGHADRLLRRSHEILTEINRILGADPEPLQRDAQERLLEQFLNKGVGFVTEKKRVRFYLVTGATIKDYLRKGGSLPGFTYEKSNDMVEYEIDFMKGSGEDEITFVIPIKRPEHTDKQVDAFFAMLNPSRFAGSAFHEVVEFTILNVRLRPWDPYFRWFSDGFATAIATRLLEKYVGREVAKRYAATKDPAEYKDIQDQVNLYHWMGHDFCIDTPPEVEGPLTNARYAYATFEAQRIIEQHGIECVAEILNLACKDKTNDSRNLDEAIREVTGEDIPKRFQRYQTFKTPSEGLAQYTEQFGAAMARKDYPDALMNLLHRLEVEGIGNPMYYGTAAYLLQKMGYEGLADQAILKPLGLMKRRGTEDSLLGMQTMFIIHAIKCGKLSKAHSMAEEVLKSKPDTIPALMVRLDRLVSLGKLDKAEKTARHILKLDNNPKSPARRLAQKTLERLKKTE